MISTLNVKFRLREETRSRQERRETRWYQAVRASKVSLSRLQYSKEGESRLAVGLLV